MCVCVYVCVLVWRLHTNAGYDNVEEGVVGKEAEENKL